MVTVPGKGGNDHELTPGENCRFTEDKSAWVCELETEDGRQAEVRVQLDENGEPIRDGKHNFDPGFTREEKDQLISQTRGMVRGGNTGGALGGHTER